MQLAGGIFVHLAELTPLMLDRRLQFAHSSRRVFLRTGLDCTPIDQTLLEHPVLPFLPEVQRQTQSIDLGLQFGEAAISSRSS